MDPGPGARYAGSEERHEDPIPEPAGEHEIRERMVADIRFPCAQSGDERLILDCLDIGGAVLFRSRMNRATR